MLFPAKQLCQIGCKLEKWQWCHNFLHGLIVKFLWRSVFIVKFNYWIKFYVNIITGSGVMTISFYKRLIKNPEIGNTPVWVLTNIWRLGWFKNTKCDMKVCKKMLLNASKSQGYRFYRLCVIKGKPTGEGVKLPSPT